MGWGAALGGILQMGAGVADAKSERDANRRAGRDIQFNPWDINGPGGSIQTYSNGPYGATSLRASLDPTSQAIADSFGSQAQMFGSPYNPNMPLANWGISQATSDMPGLYGGAMQASFLDPSIYGNAAGQMGAAMDSTGAMGGMLGGAGANYLMGMGPGQQQAAQMFGAGQGLLGSQAQSYQSVADQQLSLLRQQAAPQEERAQNSLMNKLFSMGQLGGSGGGLMTRNFAEGLGQADLQRQVTAQNFGNSLYSQDLQAAIARQGMGSNLMQAGMGGMFQGTQIGQGLLGAGLGAAGQYGGMAGSLYGMGMNTADATNARAQQRMANATSLFGLGNQTYGSNLQNQLAASGGMMNLNASLLDYMKMSGALGQGTMQAAIARAPYTVGTAGSVQADLASGIGGMLSGGMFSGIGGGGATAGVQQAASTGWGGGGGGIW